MKYLHWIVLLLACLVSAGPVDVCKTGVISDTLRIGLVAGGGSVSTSLACHFSADISTPAISYAVPGVVYARMASGTLTLMPAYVQFTAPVRDTVTVSTTTEKVGVIVDVKSCVTTASASFPQIELEPGGTLALSIADYFKYSGTEALVYTAGSSDPDIFTVSLSYGRMTLTGGALPEGASRAEAELNLTAKNSCGAAAGTVAVVLAVRTTNRAPTCNPIAVTLTVNDDNEVFDMDDYCSDPDSDNLKYKLGNVRGSSARITLAGDDLTISPSEAGTTRATVTTDDGNGNTATSSITVTVSTVNSPPTCNNIAATLTVNDGNEVFDMDDYCSDLDNDDLTYELGNVRGSSVRITLRGNVLTISPSQVGTTTATVTANDGNGNTATSSITVTVSTVNSPPTCNNIAATLTVNDGNEVFDMDDYCSDLDNDDLTYELGNVRGSSVRITLRGNVLTISPSQVGTTTATVTANDGNGNTATSSITATVNNLPPKKVGTISDIVVHPDDDDKMFSVVSYFSDPENEALVYTASSSPSGVVTVSMGAGDDAGKLTLSDYSVGSSMVTVTATDPHKAKAKQAFQFSAVCSVPTSSTIPNQFILLHTEADIALDNYFSDPRNDELSYTATQTGVPLTLDISDDNTLTIDPENVGSATVAITAVNDCGGTSAPQSFGVTVRGKPVASGSIPGQSLVVSGTAKTLDVSDYFSEPDGDTVAYSAYAVTTLARIPDYVSVSMSGSTLTMTPGTRFGRINFEVTATDRDGSATQSFTVFITLGI